jgi:hypothetical protein
VPAGSLVFVARSAGAVIVLVVLRFFENASACRRWQLDFVRGTDHALSRTMKTSLLQSVLVVALVGGCSASGHLTYAGEATVPELVVISPGVQVIADFDTPIFYSSNYYWRNASGFWYRSRSHNQGWARAQVVPVEIRAIARPSAYVRYRGQARANVSGDRQTHSPATQPRDRREVVVPASDRDNKRE